jgi:hypothetical protein
MTGENECAGLDLASTRHNQNAIVRVRGSGNGLPQGASNIQSFRYFDVCLDCVRRSLLDTELEIDLRLRNKPRLSTAKDNLANR